VVDWNSWLETIAAKEPTSETTFYSDSVHGRAIATNRYGCWFTIYRGVWIEISEDDFEMYLEDPYFKLAELTELPQELQNNWSEQWT